MTRIFVPDTVLLDDGTHDGWGVAVDGDGRIEAVGSLALLDPEAERVALAGRVLCPGFVNTHSHSFQVLLRGFSESCTDFRDWVDAAMYPLVERISGEQIYLAARLAFLEMLQAGTTTIGEFYYIHNGPGGEPLGNALDAEAIRAATELGFRICLLRTLYDQGQRPGQARFKETVADAVAHTRALAAAYADNPLVTVAVAPHSLHGASAEMIQAGAELARELDAPLHIHLAEQQGDLPFSQARYGASPLRALDGLGIVDERLVCVHGCWLDPGECELLGGRGGGLAYNPLTNMALGDGVTPIPSLLRAGVSVSVGTDANHKLSIPDELRAVEMLQRIGALEMGILPGLDAQRSCRGLWNIGTACGGQNLGLPVGRLEPGCWADLIAVDLAHPSLQPAAAVGGEALRQAILFSMVPQTAVREVIVAGQLVMRDGVPQQGPAVDLPARLRATAPSS